ncbi:hypothetical protein J3Q64DRAFT_1476673 [Phycomyces blakesleeanus]|uniref:Uncharacterized protein n=2 Tax=Phycomyces blakesleeanus TaxID=4837 RepID=A0A163DES6_PHYB8|nr:hypothetical protein PHYBLDRAFT_147996 [Phycomyces blakesleeanus NRRL 1555(-)]OAD70770.1 hypothetical protein PHYBLDRAFT_147996 [Phycomyces blakesleeanus NRRL 1555(-)]|eukprot:XP_018288810.1 hypothetical protein PHYBLDRAFT_147996 [Phycomyces blakesleeanus NRRL 1555(-)]
MQPSLTLRAVHTPLIRFVGSRAALWKDAPHHTGPHVMTPSNLEKHVAKASEVVAKTAAPAAPTTFTTGDMPARYRRAPITELEMEAIESGGATYSF